MPDFIFATFLLLTSFGVGLPLSLLLPASTRMRYLAAPPLGFGAIAVLTAAAYRYGLSLSAMTAVLSISAGSMMVWQSWKVLRFSSLRVMVGGITAAAASVLLLCLLPKWTGGAQFAAFQGNHYDQLAYLTQAVYFKTYGYEFLHEIAFTGLDARPPAAMVLAAFADLTQTSVIERSYAYIAALQALMFFPATFLILNLFRAPVWIAVLGAAALTLGFSMQYVVDINAWSQLAAMPNAVLCVALVSILLQPEAADTAPFLQRAVRWMFIISPLAVFLFYTYPEITVPYGAALCGMVAFFLLSLRLAKKTSSIGLENLAIATASAALGLICAIYLNDTVKYLIGQGTDGATSVEWWRYYQAYLFGPQFPGSILTINFGLSLVGLYPVLPQPSYPRILTWMLYIADAALLIAILTTAFLVWKRYWRGTADLRPWLLLSATVGASIIPLAFLAAGAFWVAGKGLTMAAPLLFFVLSAPLLFPGARSLLLRIPTGLLWAVCLIFGLVRPIAAMNEFGIHYASPYPSVQEAGLKSKLSWDLARHRADFKACQGIALNLNNLALRRYLQLYLTELSVAWSLTDPVDFPGAWNLPAKPTKVENPDCIIDDKYKSYPSRTLINLSMDQRFAHFLHSRTGSLEVGVDSPAEAEVSGMYPVETYQGSPLRWSSAAARIELPFDPEYPPKSLDLVDLAIRYWAPYEARTQRVDIIRRSNPRGLTTSGVSARRNEGTSRYNRAYRRASCGHH